MRPTAEQIEEWVSTSGKMPQMQASSLKANWYCIHGNLFSDEWLYDGLNTEKATVDV